ncbi:hypothetical protein DFH09DRAFT_1106462 [Mycena vulgaris]|nr:hypothetical protein DFH09DRAFT_1106462 [Mycena vulgaris]
MPPKPSNAATKAVATMPALRPKRAKQPGGPDMPRTKRTSEQVQQAKQAKDDEKQEAEEKRRQGVSNAAAIENRIDREDQVRDEHANHPPTTELKKVLRPRPEKPKEDENAGTPAPVDPFSDGPGSSDDFKLDAQAPDPSDDELMDASDDEGVKPAKPGRPKKPGKGSLRQAMNEERVRLVCRSSRSEPSKKAKRAVGGIRVDWTRGRTPAVIPSLHGPSRSRSTGSAMSFISHQRDASSEADFDPPDSDSSVIGGIPSDVNDGEERSFADALPEKAKVARTKSLRTRSSAGSAFQVTTFECSSTTPMKITSYDLAPPRRLLGASRISRASRLHGASSFSFRHASATLRDSPRPLRAGQRQYSHSLLTPLSPLVLSQSLPGLLYFLNITTLVLLWTTIVLLATATLQYDEGRLHLLYLEIRLRH